MKDDVLIHYGTPQHFVNDPNGSGRYRKGTGDHAYQRDNSLMGQYHYYKQSGQFNNDTEIARAMGLSSGQLRDLKGNAKKEQRALDRAKAIELMDKQRNEYGKVNVSQIAREMYGDPKKESYIRNLLNDTLNERSQRVQNTADMLRKQVDEKKYIDVGAGVENRLNMSKEQLRAAVRKLQDEGYQVVNVYVDQVNSKNGDKTTIKTLVGPDCTWAEANKNYDKIKLIDGFSENNGRTLLNVEPPVSVDSKRIQINYESPKDGVIELRRGVPDLSLGDAMYAQVRIAVDDTHYLKGMAMYSDKMPDGIDIMFNTNKHKGTPMMADNKDDPQVLKPLKKNKDNIFGATIKNDEQLKLTQRYYIDENGNRKQSAINVVNEQGDWSNWKKALSSQVLSKQPTSVAKKQLDITAADQRAQLEEIKAYTNPVVKQKLLDSFADDCDSKAVHLKAASFPNQASHVILPFPEIRDNEVYAANYDNGETVALIRYPHGGKFEIPVLTVNNKNRTAKSLIGGAPDAIGINPKVAGKLSGADFDGDTVLVIPINKRVKVQTDNDPAFKVLQTFDPKESYPGYKGMRKMTEEHKQKEMGVVSNLITDMTIGGASPDEIVRAVKHSMVVIDAPKHGLDWRTSEKDNGIKQLKEKYQTGGASTIISRAKSEERVPERKELTNTSKMTPEQLADWKAGKKVYVETGKTYKTWKNREQITDPALMTAEQKKAWKEGKKVYNDSKTGKPYVYDDAHMELHERQTVSTKMAESRTPEQVYKLSSGTPIEKVYADHAILLKGMADEARRESRAIKGSNRDPQAVKVYAKEVSSLNNKLDRAMRNKPLERQAQIIANKTIQMELKEHPDMYEDKDDKKRLKRQALNGARYKVGKDPYTIDITPKEWEAIQAGALSKDRLSRILDNADMDQVKKYATPKQQKSMTPAKIARAKAMIAAGHTQAEVAKALGVSVSTISNNV